MESIVLKIWNRKEGYSGMTLNIVESTAMAIEGPCGNEGGIDRFVMT